MIHLDEPLPSEQHAHPGLPELPERVLHARRERLFLVFAGLFLGTLAMLNILAISRFIFITEIAGVPIAVPVGVLPYPITFLCTDFISELYGKRRANRVVWMGLVLNVWVVFILWLGGVLPGAGTEEDEAAFFAIRTLAFGAVTASMIAYMVAQFVDVYVFHFWKKLTKGKHLWIRNNGSTLVSQLVDTTAVILITHFYAKALPIDEGRSLVIQLATFIGAGYAFKLIAALLDTVPFIYGTRFLVRYLRLPTPGEETELAIAEQLSLGSPDAERSAD
ncbi:MAG: queuosine precursor transporter [Planctomycetota bacterium]